MSNTFKDVHLIVIQKRRRNKSIYKTREGVKKKNSEINITFKESR